MNTNKFLPQQSLNKAFIKVKTIATEIDRFQANLNFDSNTLNQQFYDELLHIIGLIEIKKGGKFLIERPQKSDRHSGSLLENTITQLDSLDKVSRLNTPTDWGENYQDQLFHVSLELVITWINRILFLKLLEAQLINYHKDHKEEKLWAFLNSEKITNYEDLNILFFSVLALKNQDRSHDLQKIFGHIPYLNSSLFEPTELEEITIFISNLREEKLAIFPTTVLKYQQGKRRSGQISTQQYLLEFLNAYNFGSEGLDTMQNDRKTLINAPVLGLIFEKINGYQNGSFFTPSFITMYMCRQTIRRAVVQKFNQVKGWNCENFDDLYDKIEDRKEANTIINSLKICDPAVGSGHFLVSALNEIIAIKSELKIFLDRNGKRLKEYHIEIVNDELVITDENGQLFTYQPPEAESQRVQEAIFHEKQTIIENCLFGVDINPNSVKICRLRLWIELLKNAYYIQKPGFFKKPDFLDFIQKPGFLDPAFSQDLKTLPNIDINIKCGNSLISHFPLDVDLRQALQKSKFTIEDYRQAVKTYRQTDNKSEKRQLEKLISQIKNSFSTEIFLTHPKRQQLRQKKAEIEELEAGKIYQKALEWRFEFPEVLNDEGDFIGFDVVIGNPPYGVELNKIVQNFLHKTYNLGTIETAILFVHKGWHLLNEQGQQSYIIPKSYTFASNYAKIRAFTINNLVELVDCGKVWRDVKLELCIFILNKKNRAYFMLVIN